MAAVSCLLLPGCGGAADPSGDDPSEPTSSESPSAPASVSGLPEPTEAVEAATGPRLHVQDVRVRAPRGWKQTFDTLVVDTAQGDDGSVFLSVAGTGAGQVSLKEAERWFWTQGERPQNYEKQEQLSLGGVSANQYTYHDQFDDYRVVNTWDAGYVIQVMVTADRSVPDDEQLEIFESVLASYEGPRA